MHRVVINLCSDTEEDVAASTADSTTFAAVSTAATAPLALPIKPEESAEEPKVWTFEELKRENFESAFTFLGQVDEFINRNIKKAPHVPEIPPEVRDELQVLGFSREFSVPPPFTPIPHTPLIRYLNINAQVYELLKHVVYTPEYKQEEGCDLMYNICSDVLFEFYASRGSRALNELGIAYAHLAKDHLAKYSVSDAIKDKWVGAVESVLRVGLVVLPSGGPDAEEEEEAVPTASEF